MNDYIRVLLWVLWLPLYLWCGIHLWGWSPLQTLANIGGVGIASFAGYFMASVAYGAIIDLYNKYSTAIRTIQQNKTQFRAFCKWQQKQQQEQQP
ncbi:hypothetical protein [Paralysiella testudinis]|nr:hypothetical protein [Paralysiella testudinis]QRQ81101.1 hypothetical protein JQU52_10245 [Paralysiella testudinis]